MSEIVLRILWQICSGKSGEIKERTRRGEKNTNGGKSGAIDRRSAIPAGKGEKGRSKNFAGFSEREGNERRMGGGGLFHEIILDRVIRELGVGLHLHFFQDAGAIGTDCLYA